MSPGQPLHIGFERGAAFDLAGTSRGIDQGSSGQRTDHPAAGLNRARPTGEFRTAGVSAVMVVAVVRPAVAPIQGSAGVSTGYGAQTDVGSLKCTGNGGQMRRPRVLDCR